MANPFFTTNATRATQGQPPINNTPKMTPNDRAQASEGTKFGGKK